jgi:hypothetical protein
VKREKAKTQNEAIEMLKERGKRISDLDSGDGVVVPISTKVI